MNVSNGTSGQNGNIPGGMNTTGHPVQPQQQSMINTQQPNLTKHNSQVNMTQPTMSNMQQNMNMQQGYQQQQQSGIGYQQAHQQAPNMGYQQPMGQAVYPMMPVKSTLGLVGLILSILSLICCGPVLAIPGLICSIIALIKHRGEKRAFIGTIISVISIVLWIVLWLTGMMSFNKISLNNFNGNNHDIVEEKEDSDINNNDIDDSYFEDECDNDDTCNNDTEENDEYEPVIEDTDLGIDVVGDFHPRSVVYNGYTLDMGLYTASELESLLDYEFEDADMEYVLNPGYYSYATYQVETEPYDRIIYFYFMNDTDEALPVSECNLYSISFHSADYLNGDTLSDWCNIELGSGITTDSSEEDIIAVLGEPDNTYTSDEYNTSTIEYYKLYDYSYKVKFSYKDGKMTELTVGGY